MWHANSFCNSHMREKCADACLIILDYWINHISFIAQTIDHYVCTYIYICIYIYMCACVHIYIYICACVHIYIYVYIYIYVCVCVRVCINKYIYIYICIYILHIVNQKHTHTIIIDNVAASCLIDTNANAFEKALWIPSWP